MSLYAQDFVAIFSAPKFQEAFSLSPYFAFGRIFMGLTDYTTLQYHLANKTYIDFIIKLISGIVGIALNIILIPKIGLEGVGVATLGANFLYYFLSIIIVLPGLRLLYPVRIIFGMLLSFLPMGFIHYLFLDIPSLTPIIKMIVLMLIFYVCYFAINNNMFKRNINC